MRRVLKRPAAFQTLDLSQERNGKRYEGSATRKELASAVVALALAFLAVQSASILQSPPAAPVVKGEFATEQAVRPQAGQPSPSSWAEMLPAVVFVPLAIAAACYLFVRRAI